MNLIIDKLSLYDLIHADTTLFRAQTHTHWSWCGFLSPLVIRVKTLKSSFLPRWPVFDESENDDLWYQVYTKANRWSPNSVSMFQPQLLLYRTLYNFIQQIDSKSSIVNYLANSWCEWCTYWRFYCCTTLLIANTENCVQNLRCQSPLVGYWYVEHAGSSYYEEVGLTFLVWCHYQN